MPNASFSPSVHHCQVYFGAFLCLLHLRRCCPIISQPGACKQKSHEVQYSLLIGQSFVICHSARLDILWALWKVEVCGLAEELPAASFFLFIEGNSHSNGRQKGVSAFCPQFCLWCPGWQAIRWQHQAVGTQNLCLTLWSIWGRSHGHWIIVIGR